MEFKECPYLKKIEESGSYSGNPIYLESFQICSEHCCSFYNIKREKCIYPSVFHKQGLINAIMSLMFK